VGKKGQTGFLVPGAAIPTAWICFADKKSWTNGGGWRRMAQIYAFVLDNYSKERL